MESAPETGAVKKPAWNIPATLNGPIETGPPVIDESSWPALSESAKKVSDGSALGSTIASPSSPSKPQFPNPNPNSPTLPNPNSPSRSKPAPNPDNPDQTAIRPPYRRGGYNGNNPSTRRPAHNNNNNTTTTRGGNNNNSNRGGQYRNVPPQVGVVVPPPPVYGVPPVYVRPPPPPPLPGTVTAPFIAPPPVPVRPPPFGGPMGYPDMPPSPVYYVPGPGPVPQFMPAGAPVFLPPLDHQRTALLKQIDYYFSSDNLCKDTWLRGQMDEQGFVPISLIANFNKVKQITTNIPYILETLRMSFFVEVQGDKIRRKGDWANWLIKPTNFEADNLSTRFNQNVSLEGSSNQNPNEITKSGSGSNLDNLSQEGEKHGGGEQN